MNYRDFLPPIVRRKPKPNPTFPTYAEAKAFCGTGYDDSELARVVLEKTRRAVQANTLKPDATTLLGLVAASRKEVRVLDFGGAFGAAYFGNVEAAKLLGLTLKWAVVESTAFTRAAEIRTDWMRFFDSVRDARQWLGEVDLVYSSGAIQYTPSPEETLKSLVAIEPRALVLLRCLWSKGERVVEVQSSMLSENGPGPLPEGVADRQVRYPRTLVREWDALGIMGRAGYKMVVQTEDSQLWTH